MTCHDVVALIPPDNDAALTSSSSYNDGTAAPYSRLDTVIGNGHYGAWSARTNSQTEWIRVSGHDVRASV